jgi:hypothetical protein
MSFSGLRGQSRGCEAILATEFGDVRDERGNPCPGVEISSVDLVYGKDKDRGVSVLLAVTEATAQ